ncbi:DUF2279 domain-containing protein [Oscillatoria amoena NRMC-F 0135]|nr:DUF2279 domain-containing protein [Oscillatoria amoena NRMC-F 0135]
MKAINLLILIYLSISFTSAQDSTQVVDRKRLHTVILAGAAGYTATLIGLNQLWYSESEKQPFTFFNDNKEWKQMDKVGHFYAAFQFSSTTSSVLQWSNLKKQKADLWGSLTGFLVLLPIEIMDGYSADYGASVGDLVANASGAAFYLGQSVLWNEVRLHPKFSFHRTGYPPLRPDGTLGDSPLSEMLKDYNGQTYWLSVDLDKFFQFPKWLNLSFGYGAQDMVYANEGENMAAGYDAYRQYYVGIDFDLSHIKTKSKILNSALFIVNMIKLPAPAIEFSRKGARFNLLQF